jgi:SAM-dependent methyltransferase
MCPAGGSQFGQETDNTAKFERAQGVEAWLLSRFRERLLATVRDLSPGRLLDAGCGEGYVTGWLARELPETEIVAVDGRAEAIQSCAERNPGVRALVADLLALPFDAGEFDLVVCTEVLEHLDEPRVAVRELARVSSRHLLLTVPHEPFFRSGNLARGRYVGRLGSTPGHVSTWSKRGFLRLIDTEAEPVRWFGMFPWQAVLARVGRDSEQAAP